MFDYNTHIFDEYDALQEERAFNETIDEGGRYENDRYEDDENGTLEDNQE